MEGIPDLKGDQEPHQEHVDPQRPEDDDCSPTQQASPKTRFHAGELIWLQHFMHPCHVPRFRSFSGVDHFVFLLSFVISVTFLFALLVLSASRVLLFFYDGRRTFGG